MKPRSLQLALMLAAFAGSGIAAEPILEWRFDDAVSPAEWWGQPGVPAAGPRAPKYPDFKTNNMAMSFAGHEGAILVKDHERGGKANIRFGRGDTLGFEAWVRIRSIGSGWVYLIGKGRHIKHGEEFSDANQNYSVRLQGSGGGGHLNFLFTSRNPTTGKVAWHRWNSDRAIPVGGWHHIAFEYTFGQADSARGYLDGKPSTGVWSADGPTDQPPVQDADDLVIGTGYSRGEGSSFKGWLDNVALYRRGFNPREIAQAYRFVRPPPPVNPDMVPPGRVLVQISEKGVPEANGWPDEPVVTESYEEEAFGFFEAPQKYISTGVRADRANPSHVRAAAMVTLPQGRHRLLLRGRGLTRLFIDGEEILETAPRTTDSGGHTPLAAQDDYLDLGPDFRFAPPGNREVWRAFASAGGEHFIVLETMLGNIKGKLKQRPEFGETVAAISLEGSESWSLISPGQRRVPYTDEGWAAYEAERREQLDRINAKARAVRRAANAAYWKKRRAAAEDWLAGAGEAGVPELPKGLPANNPIDHFIGSRIAAVARETRQDGGSGADYHRQVRPLLEKRCHDCHQGGRAKGGLRIDELESMLKGGRSDGPAIIPGNAAESALIHRITTDDEDDIMPPKGDPLSADEIALLKRWIQGGASWPQFDVANFKPNPPADDLAFLRRVTLDTVGVTPSEAEIAAFLKDPRRDKVIDRLLADRRWADHWMGYWLDVLAENPNVINPTLNNTGPFRWWLYESLLDNKPADLFVTELIRMEGSERFGGPAGFATASQNDLPMAAKGIIVSSAFLGVEMKCARCHDAPSHISKQRDLLQLAALLKQDAIKLPKSSSVPDDRLHQTGRKPLIEVTMKPGEEVKPAWPFARYCDEKVADQLAENPGSPRDRLAALITAPQNERFAQVMVNRIWRRLMGRGLVANVSDWEKGGPSHPGLLRWLGREFVRSGYDMKAVARLILNSHAYQRAADPSLSQTSPLFVSPAPRRLTAEQIVDSVFHAAGAPFDLEEVSLDIDSVREIRNALTLGKPRRSWMLASTSNERDRPSLGLPRVTAVASVLRAFGWRGARQDPRSERETEPNILQPAIYANGVMGVWLTRLSNRHDFTRIALENQSLEQLVDRLFLRLLTRKPSKRERQRFVALLREGYEDRVVPEADRVKPEPTKRERSYHISWSNHVDGPANALAVEREAEVRRGDPPTNALQHDWRLRMEDALWAVLNTPEWIYTP